MSSKEPILETKLASINKFKAQFVGEILKNLEDSLDKAFQALLQFKKDSSSIGFFNNNKSPIPFDQLCVQNFSSFTGEIENLIEEDLTEDEQINAYEGVLELFPKLNDELSSLIAADKTVTRQAIYQEALKELNDLFADHSGVTQVKNWDSTSKRSI